MARYWLALLVVVLVAGCIGTTPQEELEAEQGDDPNPPTGPTHRPGQRCLACHGDDHNPGGQVFILAGTVYRRADDVLGLAGAEVEVEDDDGAVLHINTNRAGNFMVSIGDGSPDEGWLGVSSEPVFPLHVTVRAGDAEQSMRNVIHREGACAACHDRAGKSATSNGLVYVEKTP